MAFNRETWGVCPAHSLHESTKRGRQKSEKKKDKTKEQKRAKT
jgi:hypothetical protein